MPVPITVAARAVDLSSRVVQTSTVGASPALAAETIIGTLVVPPDLTLSTGIIFEGWAAFTIGTTGSAARMRLRQTNVSGTVVGDTGALTGGIAAAALVQVSVSGFDAASTAVGTYVLTLTVTAATAGSTVSALQIYAICV